MNFDRAKELVSNFDKQVLVVGDVMLDRFVRGSVGRFSPEAPSCPVLDQTETETMLGGAGNVATNLAHLGAKCVRLVGLSGYDTIGQELNWHMQQAEENIDNQLVRCGNRPTTVKTRFVAHDDRHLLRHDVETTEPGTDQDQKMLLNRVRDMARICQGIIVEDYDKGTITRDVMGAIMDIAAGQNIPVFIDPKKNHWEHFRDAEVVKPNLDEAFAAMGRPDQVGCPECSIEEAGQWLLRYTRAKAVIITRGEEGMSLFERDADGTGIAWALPTPVEVVDVSGAGDTTMATLTLARLAGASWLEAMDLANTAAGIAVGKPGTSTVSAEELLSRFGGEENA